MQTMNDRTKNDYIYALSAFDVRFVDYSTPLDSSVVQFDRSLQVTWAENILA
ncbi:hypothetical protein Tcan_13815 [Toxocara canis]|uniref:Uncharacterized protein n=1 Tax=Toxocara canis TaxID=6265 RepID=A0A0B2VP95_TOXCA|nr:hypothetical protein Tcan_13815 [Toxocara canis]